MRHSFLLVFLFGLLAPVAQAWAQASASGEITCPLCKGDGICHAPGCKDGQLLCPGECLKLEVGQWDHNAPPGYSADMLWTHRTWKTPGFTHHMDISQPHVGQVFKMVDGDLKDLGPCPICGGTSHIDCPACDGGKCPLCSGKRTLKAGKDIVFVFDKKGRSVRVVPQRIDGEALVAARFPDGRVLKFPLATLSDASARGVRDLLQGDKAQP